MKLAILPAGIDSPWQITQKLFVEIPPGKFRPKLLRIDAYQLGFQAAPDHLLCKLIRRYLPDREQRFQARTLQLTFPVGANVLQEQIAEGNRRYPLRYGFIAHLFHSAFIISIRT